MSLDPNSAETRSTANSSELKLRLVSAAIGLPALGAVLFLGFWAVSVAAIAVAAVVGFEIRRMVGSSFALDMRGISTAAIGGIVVAICVAVAAFADPTDSQGVASAVGIVFALFALEIVLTARFRQHQTVRRNIVYAYGAAVAVAVAMLPFIASLDDGREILTYCILVVFAADSGAFLVGKVIGRNKLAPSISPGKTWEGLIGGVAAAVLASWLLSEILSLGYTAPRIVGVGLAIAIIGVSGDLTESWIKRLSGVKDSGGIIPGHGGILDRLDALAPNFMLIYFVERWLG